MGNNVSCPTFTEQMLEDYELLTYLSKYEILRLFKIFYLQGKEQLDNNFHYRFPCEIIINWFPNLRCNPFIMRICEVFSSYKDGCFSFEDMLDLCSVMSENCPEKVKARWAFKIFDVDDDGKISSEDICKCLDLLTGNKKINDLNKKYIAEILLDGINIQKTGGINELEFEHAVSKMSEFVQTFRFSI